MIGQFVFGELFKRRLFSGGNVSLWFEAEKERVFLGLVLVVFCSGCFEVPVGCGIELLWDWSKGQ